MNEKNRTHLLRRSLRQRSFNKARPEQYSGKELAGADDECIQVAGELPGLPELGRGQSVLPVHLLDKIPTSLAVRTTLLETEGPRRCDPVQNRIAAPHRIAETGPRSFRCREMRAVL